MKNKFDIAKNIKEHEKKYTIALVILFVFLILFTGYCILSIDNKELKNINKSINYRYSSLSSTYQTVTLTNKNILNDKIGLDSNKYTIHIENTTNEKYDYKIVLKKDSRVTKTCGCINHTDDYRYIKYSLDSKEILRLNQNMVIYQGTLKKNEEKDILVNIWLDEMTDKNYHYHGYFSIEKINQD